MDATALQQIKAGSPGVLVVITAADLKQAVGELFKEEQERQTAVLEAHRERPTLTRQEAAKALNVTLTTLWRWATIGYLCPVKIGTKVLYRATDIDAILEKKADKSGNRTPQQSY